MTTAVNIIITFIIFAMAILFLVFVSFSLYTAIRDDVRKERERKAEKKDSKK